MTKTRIRRFWAVLFALVITCVFAFSFVVFAEDAPAFPQGILNYPTPSSGPVDFFYLWFPSDNTNQGEWVRAVATVSAGFDGYVLTAPSGYQIKDCAGLGIAVYADATHVSTIGARFIIQCPAMYDNDLGTYINNFYNPHFNICYYRSGSDWKTIDNGIMITNDSYVGDDSHMCLFDYTIYLSNLWEFTEGSDITTGNFLLPVYFEASYNQQIFVRFIDGFYNLSTNDSVWLAMAQSTIYSGPALQERTSLELATTTLNNLNAMSEANDPFAGLAIARALAAVYNPVIEAAFASHGVFFYFMILLFVLLTVTVIVKWLRRE